MTPCADRSVPSAADHMDTCDTRLLPNQGYACTCGYDDLRARLVQAAEIEAMNGLLARENEDEKKLSLHWMERARVADMANDELRAQNEALFAALRDHCLITLYTPITDEPKTSCLQCDKNWHGRTPEHHAPGCLAALAQDEQAAGANDGK